MRILIVSELASIHSARWVNQLKDTGWEVHVYQGYPRTIGVCPEYRYGILHLPGIEPIPTNLLYRLTEWIKPHPFSTGLETVPESMSDIWLAKNLANLIRVTKPDIIHSLGLNIGWTNMTLSVLRARQILGNFDMPWIYSSWGTDLGHYANMSPAHRREVMSVLSACDYHIAESERDVRLCRELGFKGKSAGILPAFGGVTWDAQTYPLAGLPSQRRTILLKGRDISGGDPQGRAMTAMKSFVLCQDVLTDYQIVVSGASPTIAEEAKRLSETTNLNIQVIPELRYPAWLRTMATARILIALTVSDGLPSTLVEAMSLGAFPIHSGLESIQEWIHNGENGLLVPPEAPHAVADALRLAIRDDNLVDRACKINAELVAKQLSSYVVGPKAINIYKDIANRKKTIDQIPMNLFRRNRGGESHG